LPARPKDACQSKNTGGQASKATPLGAIAQLDKSLTLGHPKASFHGSRLIAIFAAQGKRIRKSQEDWTD
jgi:pyruvate/2-oxoacid:ferredoxin oxidoreductase beta subunit